MSLILFILVIGIVQAQASSNWVTTFGMGVDSNDYYHAIDGVVSHQYGACTLILFVLIVHYMCRYLDTGHSIKFILILSLMPYINCTEIRKEMISNGYVNVTWGNQQLDGYCSNTLVVDSALQCTLRTYVNGCYSGLLGCTGYLFYNNDYYYIDRTNWYHEGITWSRLQYCPGIGTTYCYLNQKIVVNGTEGLCSSVPITGVVVTVPLNVTGWYMTKCIIHPNLRAVDKLNDCTISCGIHVGLQCSAIGDLLCIDNGNVVVDTLPTKYNVDCYIDNQMVFHSNGVCRIAQVADFMMSWKGICAMVIFVLLCCIPCICSWPKFIILCCTSKQKAYGNSHKMLITLLLVYMVATSYTKLVQGIHSEEEMYILNDKSVCNNTVCNETYVAMYYNHFKKLVMGIIDDVANTTIVVYVNKLYGYINAGRWHLDDSKFAYSCSGGDSCSKNLQRRGLTKLGSSPYYIGEPHKCILGLDEVCYASNYSYQDDELHQYIQPYSMDLYMDINNVTYTLPIYLADGSGYYHFTKDNMIFDVQIENMKSREYIDKCNNIILPDQEYIAPSTDRLLKMSKYTYHNNNEHTVTITTDYTHINYSCDTISALVAQMGQITIRGNHKYIQSTRLVGHAKLIYGCNNTPRLSLSGNDTCRIYGNTDTVVASNFSTDANGNYTFYCVDSGKLTAFLHCNILKYKDWMDWLIPVVCSCVGIIMLLVAYWIVLRRRKKVMGGTISKLMLCTINFIFTLYLDNSLILAGCASLSTLIYGVDYMVLIGQLLRLPIYNSPYVSMVHSYMDMQVLHFILVVILFVGVTVHMTDIQSTICALIDTRIIHIVLGSLMSYVFYRMFCNHTFSIMMATLGVMGGICATFSPVIYQSLYPYYENMTLSCLTMSACFSYIAATLALFTLHMEYGCIVFCIMLGIAYYIRHTIYQLMQIWVDIMSMHWVIQRKIVTVFIVMVVNTIMTYYIITLGIPVFNKSSLYNVICLTAIGIAVFIMTKYHVEFEVQSIIPLCLATCVQWQVGLPLLFIYRCGSHSLWTFVYDVLTIFDPISAIAHHTSILGDVVLYIERDKYNSIRFYIIYVILQGVLQTTNVLNNAAFGTISCAVYFVLMIIAYNSRNTMAQKCMQTNIRNFDRRLMRIHDESRARNAVHNYNRERKLLEPLRSYAEDDIEWISWNAGNYPLYETWRAVSRYTAIAGLQTPKYYCHQAAANYFDKTIKFTHFEGKTLGEVMEQYDTIDNIVVIELPQTHVAFVKDGNPGLPKIAMRFYPSHMIPLQYYNDGTTHVSCFKWNFLDMYPAINDTCIYVERIWENWKSLMHMYVRDIGLCINGKIVKFPNGYSTSEYTVGDVNYSIFGHTTQEYMAQGQFLETTYEYKGHRRFNDLEDIYSYLEQDGYSPTDFVPSIIDDDVIEMKIGTDRIYKRNGLYYHGDGCSIDVMDTKAKKKHRLLGYLPEKFDVKKLRGTLVITKVPNRIDINGITKAMCAAFMKHKSDMPCFVMEGCDGFRWRDECTCTCGNELCQHNGTYLGHTGAEWQHYLQGEAVIYEPKWSTPLKHGNMYHGYGYIDEVNVSAGDMGGLRHKIYSMLDAFILGIFKSNNFTAIGVYSQRMGTQCIPGPDDEDDHNVGGIVSKLTKHSIASKYSSVVGATAYYLPRIYFDKNITEQNGDHIKMIRKEACIQITVNEATKVEPLPPIYHHNYAIGPYMITSHKPLLLISQNSYSAPFINAAVETDEITIKGQVQITNDLRYEYVQEEIPGVGTVPLKDLILKYFTKDNIGDSVYKEYCNGTIEDLVAVYIAILLTIGFLIWYDQSMQSQNKEKKECNGFVEGLAQVYICIMLTILALLYYQANDMGNHCKSNGHDPEIVEENVDGMSVPVHRLAKGIIELFAVYITVLTTIILIAITAMVVHARKALTNLYDNTKKELVNGVSDIIAIYMMILYAIILTIIAGGTIKEGYDRIQKKRCEKKDRTNGIVDAIIAYIFILIALISTLWFAYTVDDVCTIYKEEDSKDNKEEVNTEGILEMLATYILVLSLILLPYITYWIVKYYRLVWQVISKLNSEESDKEDNTNGIIESICAIYICVIMTIWSYVVYTMYKKYELDIMYWRLAMRKEKKTNGIAEIIAVLVLTLFSVIIYVVTINHTDKDVKKDSKGIIELIAVYVVCLVTYILILCYDNKRIHNKITTKGIAELIAITFAALTALIIMLLYENKYEKPKDEEKTNGMVELVAETYFIILLSLLTIYLHGIYGYHGVRQVLHDELEVNDEPVEKDVADANIVVSDVNANEDDKVLQASFDEEVVGMFVPPILGAMYVVANLITLHNPEVHYTKQNVRETLEICNTCFIESALTFIDHYVGTNYKRMFDVNPAWWYKTLMLPMNKMNTITCVFKKLLSPTWRHVSACQTCKKTNDEVVRILIVFGTILRPGVVRIRGQCTCGSQNIHYYIPISGGPVVSMEDDLPVDNLPGRYTFKGLGIHYSPEHWYTSDSVDDGNGYHWLYPLQCNYDTNIWEITAPELIPIANNVWKPVPINFDLHLDLRVDSIEGMAILDPCNVTHEYEKDGGVTGALYHKYNLKPSKDKARSKLRVEYTGGVSIIHYNPENVNKGGQQFLDLPMLLFIYMHIPPEILILPKISCSNYGGDVNIFYKMVNIVCKVYNVRPQILEFSNKIEKKKQSTVEKKVKGTTLEIIAVVIATLGCIVTEGWMRWVMFGYTWGHLLLDTFIQHRYNGRYNIVQVLEVFESMKTLDGDIITARVVKLNGIVAVGAALISTCALVPLIALVVTKLPRVIHFIRNNRNVVSELMDANRSMLITISALLQVILVRKHYWLALALSSYSGGTGLLQKIYTAILYIMSVEPFAVGAVPAIWHDLYVSNVLSNIITVRISVIPFIICKILVLLIMSQFNGYITTVILYIIEPYIQVYTSNYLAYGVMCASTLLSNKWQMVYIPILLGIATIVLRHYPSVVMTEIINESHITRMLEVQLRRQLYTFGLIAMLFVLGVSIVTHHEVGGRYDGSDLDRAVNCNQISIVKYANVPEDGFCMISSILLTTYNSVDGKIEYMNCGIFNVINTLVEKGAITTKDVNRWASYNFKQQDYQTFTRIAGTLHCCILILECSDGRVTNAYSYGNTGDPIAAIKIENHHANPVYTFRWWNHLIVSGSTTMDAMLALRGSGSCKYGRKEVSIMDNVIYRKYTCDYNRKYVNVLPVDKLHPDMGYIFNSCIKLGCSSSVREALLQKIPYYIAGSYDRYGTWMFKVNDSCYQPRDVIGLYGLDQSEVANILLNMGGKGKKTGKNNNKRRDDNDNNSNNNDRRDTNNNKVDNQNDGVPIVPAVQLEQAPQVNLPHICDLLHRIDDDLDGHVNTAEGWFTFRHYYLNTKWLLWGSRCTWLIPYTSKVLYVYYITRPFASIFMGYPLLLDILAFMLTPVDTLEHGHPVMDFNGEVNLITKIVNSIKSGVAVHSRHSHDLMLKNNDVVANVDDPLYLEKSQRIADAIVNDYRQQTCTSYGTYVISAYLQMMFDGKELYSNGSYGTPLRHGKNEVGGVVAVKRKCSRWQVLDNPKMFKCTITGCCMHKESRSYVYFSCPQAYNTFPGYYPCACVCNSIQALFSRLFSYWDTVDAQMRLHIVNNYRIMQNIMKFPPKERVHERAYDIDGILHSYTGIKKMNYTDSIIKGVMAKMSELFIKLELTGLDVELQVYKDNRPICAANQIFVVLYKYLCGMYEDELVNCAYCAKTCTYKERAEMIVKYATKYKYIYCTDLSRCDGTIGNRLIELEVLNYLTKNPESISTIFSNAANRTIVNKFLSAKPAPNRLSGDPTTSVHNVYHNLYIFALIKQHYDIALVNDGDDNLWFTNEPHFENVIVNTYAQYGLKCKCEITTLNTMLFCKSRLFRGTYGWTMVRDPMQILKNLCVTLERPGSQFYLFMQMARVVANLTQTSMPIELYNWHRYMLKKFGMYFIRYMTEHNMSPYDLVDVSVYLLATSDDNIEANDGILDIFEVPMDEYHDLIQSLYQIVDKYEPGEEDDKYTKQAVRRYIQDFSYKFALPTSVEARAAIAIEKAINMVRMIQTMGYKGYKLKYDDITPQDILVTLPTRRHIHNFQFQNVLCYISESAVARRRLAAIQHRQTAFYHGIELVATNRNRQFSYKMDHSYIIADASWHMLVDEHVVPHWVWH